MYLLLTKTCLQHHSFYSDLTENKISPDNGILLDDVLKPKLLNIPLTSCFLINLDFLLPHIAHSDSNIVFPLLAFKTLGCMFSVF